MRFSPEQLQAIAHDERPHLLVSATAGAGKTTVMIERIATRLLAGVMTPDELLVMTFSEKAAAQMGERLEARLKRAAADQSQPHAKAVLDRLGEASVSTIHAFCNRLVREFSAELTDTDGEPVLEPGYGVTEPEEAAALLSEAIRSVLDELYVLAEQSDRGEREQDGVVPPDVPFFSGEITPFALAEPVPEAIWLRQFMEMAAVFAPGFTDDRLEDMLASVLRQLHSLPNYETWVKDALGRAETETSMQQDAAFLDVFAELERLMPDALRDLAMILDLPYFDRARGKKPLKTAVELEAALQVAKAVLPKLPAALTPLNPNRWNDVRAIGAQLTDLKLPNRGSADVQELYEVFTRRMMPLMQRIAGNIKNPTALKQYAPGVEFAFARSLEAQVEDELYVRPLVLRLFETALLADRRYRMLKLRQNRIDFSDFEHYALRLLENPDVAATVQARYRDIYVDEYQDTSSIQEAVIRTLTKGRIFMVGDVKQSIYRFRHANPGLFMAKAGAYRQPFGGAAGIDPDGDLLLLNTNYRSLPGILNAVNDVFSVLMQHPSGEIVYDNTHRLLAGRSNGPEDSRVDLCIVSVPEDVPDDGDEDESVLPDAPLTALDYEAQAAAETMRALLAAGVRPGQIVVLGRSHTICAHYYRTLQRFGLPVFGSDNDSLFETWELSLLDSLVTLLINERQDIPLASVMLSVLVPDPFTEEELLIIRNSTDTALPFHEAVHAYADTNERLAEKTRAFLAVIETWRRKAQRFSVHDLLNGILSETRFAEYVAALPEGPQRLSFLSRFKKWLQANDPKDLRALSAVIAKMRARHVTLKDFSNDGEGRDQIRVMTMHTSKGLEFEYVFLAGLGSALVKDRRQRLLIAEETGITSDYVDPVSGRYYYSFRHAHRQAVQAGRQMQEELRLLYVAMTRAEERLYLMGGVKSLENLQARVLACFHDEAPRVLDFNRQQRAGSLLVLLLAALRQTYASPLDSLLSGTEKTVSAGAVTIRHIGGADVSAVPAAVVPAGWQPGMASDAPDRDSIERIAARLRPGIVHADLAVEPSKLTVSELKRALDKRLAEPDGDERTDLPVSDMAYLIERPDMLRRDEAKELGTALHTVFQFLDPDTLGADPDEESYRRMLMDMVRQARLSETDLARVMPFYAAVRRFAASDAAARLRAPGTKIYREMPFTLAVPIDKHPSELTLVQGIIDLWYVTADGKVGLIDYKSDQLDAPDEEKLTALFAARYRVQLDYYALAIEKATGRTVNWKQIWAIRRGLLLTLP